jgi:predicted transcriptional regulator
MKMYLSFLENRALISYQKEGGIYRTTYKGRQFLRAYKGRQFLRAYKGRQFLRAYNDVEAS